MRKEGQRERGEKEDLFVLLKDKFLQRKKTIL